MVQRIQTLYVLISAILLGLLFTLPFADIVFGNQDYLFDIRGIVLNDKITTSGLPIAIL